MPGNFGFAQILDAVNMVNEHIEHGGIAAREAIHTGRPQAVVAGNVVGVRVHLGIAAQRLLPSLAFQAGAAVAVKEPAAHGEKAGQKLAADAVDGIGGDGRAIFKRRQGIKGTVKKAKQIAVLPVAFRNVQLLVAAFIIEAADLIVIKQILAVKVQLHVGREGEGVYLPVHHRKGLANALKHGRPNGLHGVAGRIKGAQQLGRNGGQPHRVQAQHIVKPGAAHHAGGLVHIGIGQGGQRNLDARMAGKIRQQLLQGPGVRAVDHQHVQPRAFGDAGRPGKPCGRLLGRDTHSAGLLPAHDHIARLQRHRLVVQINPSDGIGRLDQRSRCKRNDQRRLVMAVGAGIEQLLRKRGRRGENNVGLGIGADARKRGDIRIGRIGMIALDGNGPVQFLFQRVDQLGFVSVNDQAGDHGKVRRAAIGQQRGSLAGNLLGVKADHRVRLLSGPNQAQQQRAALFQQPPCIAALELAGNQDDDGYLSARQLG